MGIELATYTSQVRVQSYVSHYLVGTYINILQNRLIF